MTTASPGCGCARLMGGWCAAPTTAASSRSSTAPCRRACCRLSLRACRSCGGRSSRRSRKPRSFSRRRLDRSGALLACALQHQRKGVAMLDPHGALIYTMVIVSAADANLSDTELKTIGDIIGHLPAFRDFDRARLPKLLDSCARALARDDGLEATLDEIKAALPANLRETAYAIACDLAAADLE